jgi:putative DNA primase/helicase
LPFDYDPAETAPIFERFLNRVLPEPELQLILCEFLGYIFIQSQTLKLEKTLLLYGSGANGKSVFYDIVNALLGIDNICSYSLQSLTNDNGYFRAKLGDKLVNYASEISGQLQTAIFKAMVSGEPIEARLPYGNPFILKNYAKLIFNTNVLPRDVEFTKAYFRRFLIIPFEVTIPEAEQDCQLSQKIIASELPGVFNWVLEGLNRLLDQNHFTPSDIVKQSVDSYEAESDTVKQFLQDKNYIKHPTANEPLKDIYNQYRTFCTEDGYKALNKTNFGRRLKHLNINTERKAAGFVVFIKLEVSNEF